MMFGRVRGSIKSLIVLVGAGLLASCGGGLSSLPTIASASSAQYQVQPGDELLVTVQDVEQANNSYVVDGSGMISLPLLQEVQVAGLGLREIESRIAEGYRVNDILINPVISVQPGALRPFYVVGEVRSPGEFTYRQGMTVLSAIAAAGGYTYRAHEGKVEVVRKVDGRETRSQADENTPIMPGDRIKIYERWF